MNLNKYFEQTEILIYFVLMKGFFVLIIIWFQTNVLKAQVRLIADPRIEQGVRDKSAKQMPGYRVQLCFDSNKEAIDQVRSQFVSRYPKIDTYMRFEAPNFNLMVGDFRTLKEAEEFAEHIRGQFPLNIVHKETINLPRID